MRRQAALSEHSEDNKSSDLFSSNIDLVAVLISTFVVIALIVIPYLNESIFRLLLSIVLVIFNPGYALTAALFPGKRDASNIERITLAFGLSIAIVPLLGLALVDFGPIALGSLIGVLALFITSCSTVGMQRRRSLAASDRFVVRWSNFRDIIQLFSQQGKQRDGILSVLLAVSLLLSVAAVAYAIITPAQSDSYTEFYVLNAKGKAEDYPTQFSLANPGQVVVGVVNHEGRAVIYDLIITQEESSQSKVIHSEQLTVNDNARWEKAVLIRPDSIGKDTELKFLLYEHGGHATPYREAHLFTNVTK